MVGKVLDLFADGSIQQIAVGIPDITDVYKRQASCAPVIQPHGLILLCPGAGMWFGCAQRADGVTQTGKDYADMEGLC